MVVAPLVLVMTPVVLPEIEDTRATLHAGTQDGMREIDTIRGTDATIEIDTIHGTMTAIEILVAILAPVTPPTVTIVPIDHHVDDLMVDPTVITGLENIFLPANGKNEEKGNLNR